MAENNVFQGEMDSEIAALLGTDAKAKPAEVELPDYASIFDDAPAGEPQTTDSVDLSAERFPDIPKLFEETGHTAFDDPNYYKTALSGEGDISQRVHEKLQKFLNTKDPKDRGVFRQQLIPAFWEFFKLVGRRAPGKISDPKKYLLRFALLHPTFMDTENRTLFSKVVDTNVLNQPVYYLDEWLKSVGTGVVRPSTTDEVKVSKSNTSVRIQQFLDKAKGKLDGTRSLIRAKDDERHHTERVLNDHMLHIMEHFPQEGLENISACYNEGQKKIFSDIQETLRSLIKIDHDMEIFLRDYYSAEHELKNLQAKAEEEGAAAVDVDAVNTEFETVRQMAKMTIGRQGNHFPILTREYFHSMPSDIGTRENVISLLAWIESIDPEAYCRSYKNRLNRIVPYVVLIPSYGDYGMCWEPFDKHNRATSRGRIAVPMYPKSLQLA
ncbi:MAG: hypothetical protein LBI14_00190, partial [Treponema sp.]|nr:hypothetical protein [Treponema sp.]